MTRAGVDMGRCAGGWAYDEGAGGIIVMAGVDVDAVAGGII